MIFASFKKKLFFNKGINSGTKNCCCCKGRYNEKWDRILATVTAVLTFILLLTYVIFSALSEGTNSESADDNDSFTGRNNNSNSSSSARESDNISKCEVKEQYSKYCVVFCAELDPGDIITDHIHKATENISCDSLQPLKIVRSVFLTSTIKEGWLRSLTHSVTYLTLSKNNIQEIGSKAFAGHPFNALQQLEMEDLPLISLNNMSFINTTIDTLSLTYTNEHTISIEQQAFDGIRSTLATLNTKNCLKDGNVLSNITGLYGSSFDKLVQMDLSYNSLTNIPESAFIRAPNLVQLFLHGNKISHIHKDAFKSSAVFSPIKNLYIAHNKLSTLEETVFSQFAEDIKIDLSNNPWICNCSLQWLKNWYRFNSSLNISDSLYCANSNNKLFNDVDFGCEENQISTNTTSPPTTSHAQQTQYDYIQLECVNWGVTNTPVYYDELPYLTICIRTNLMELEIYEVDMETATFEVRVSGRTENSYIMWYNTKNKSDYGCVTIIDDTFLMENLEREATYTICALYGGETTTSPYDCVGFVVPVEWGSRTWLANKMIKPIIASLCSVFIIEAIIVGVIVFYCIRQHPKFISGNKRVVVVSTKTTDAMIMPRGYSQKLPKEAPAATNTSGYLTPKCSRTNDKRKRMLRSMSESSVLSGSYISKEEIYRRRRKEATLYELSDEEHIYESPALPPNHPSEIRKYSNCR